MNAELEILKQVCRQLDDTAIPYMLTGSFAANLYAIPRMTRDVDIVVQIGPKDVNKIFKIFEKDFYIDQTSIREAILHQQMFNIIHNEFALKIDFIIRKDEEYRRVEFQRKKQVLLDKALIWIVSPEDLIISKLYWAKESQSEMQIKDVKNIIANHLQLDIGYIQEWVKKLDLEHIYKKVHK